MQFHFPLMPIEEIPLWGSADSPSLHWFGLTFGWFWIEIDGQELFRYTQAVLNHWARDYPGASFALPYEDYQLARDWEDMLDMLPAILDPLPQDIALQVADGPIWERRYRQAYEWQRQEEDDTTAWETYYTAFSWWGQRHWNASHLVHPPRLWLWRVGDHVHARWDNRGIVLEGIPVWEAQQGEAIVPVSEFLAAVETFHTQFLTAMEQRVEAIRAAPPPGVTIDCAQLQHEQQDRFGWLATALAPSAREARREFSWEETRAALSTIAHRIGHNAP